MPLMLVRLKYTEILIRLNLKQKYSANLFAISIGIYWMTPQDEHAIGHMLALALSLTKKMIPNSNTTSRIASTQITTREEISTPSKTWDRKRVILNYNIIII
jgi:hypothetical protein